MTKQTIVLLASVLGMLALVNGIFIVIPTEAWYWFMPSVSDRGHFTST
ncbi:hypothetical protein HG263_01575 [Pseudoalteromonas sp. JBTF-M23]|uniref:Uncharacterized protein n=1 Tax=Pseudoalteromonas caenipelagi TaxID=2726988 RepID=A0A849V9C9_9GAMM|nr:hypothetical protein [Pseudoalteromonas caenipelagi]NOU49243.1 hypothetical protein [Pseudoalteromonas caenipelagi]